LPNFVIFTFYLAYLKPLEAKFSSAKTRNGERYFLALVVIFFLIVSLCKETTFIDNFNGLNRYKDFIAQSQLVEQEYTNNQAVQLKNLLYDYEAIIRFLRLHIDVFTNYFKDFGNADYITGLMEK